MVESDVPIISNLIVAHLREDIRVSFYCSLLAHFLHINNLGHLTDTFVRRQKLHKVWFALSVAN